MSLYLVNSIMEGCSTQGGPPSMCSTQGGPPSIAASSSSAGDDPQNTVTSSTIFNQDGTTVTTTEIVRPDGSKTVKVETTDPQGTRTVQETEFAACTRAEDSFGSRAPVENQEKDGVSCDIGYMTPSDEPTYLSELYKDVDKEVASEKDAEEFFCKKHYKFILVLLAIGIAGAVASTIAVFFLGGDSSDDGDDNPKGLEGTSFKEVWDSEEGVIVGPSYNTFTVTSLTLCARQCDVIGAKAGFFKRSRGLNDPPVCGCEFDSTCLDPELDIPGAQVFAQFPQPGICRVSFCELSPDDPLCAVSPETPQPTPTVTTKAPIPPTPFPTPLTPPPTPAPAPTPPTPVNPSPSLATPQASLYFTAWFGVNDPDDNCEMPQSDVSISCGAGATLDMLNSTSNIQCTPVGEGALTCSPVLEEDSFSAWVVYACIGTTEEHWTTEVEAIPDDSVQCTSGGAAGTRIFLSQRCPGEGDDFNQMQCNPTGALGTNTDGFNNCLTFDICTAATCSLVTPAVKSSIGLSAISRDCLFAVSESDGPPPTPTPTPVPAVAPTRTAMSAWYQAEWFGVTSEAELCEDPTPGILISCGEGGAISILDTTPTATCQILAATEQISCTGTNSENGFWGILYACRGTTSSAWTTRVEAVPDPSVPCQGGGAAGTRILIGKRCANEQSVEYRDVECDPSDARSVAASGRDSCLAFDICLQENCELTTLPVAAEISEATITQECLRR